MDTKGERSLKRSDPPIRDMLCKQKYVLGCVNNMQSLIMVLA